MRVRDLYNTINIQNNKYLRIAPPVPDAVPRPPPPLRLAGLLKSVD